MPVQDTDNFLVCSSGYSYRITAAALKSKLNGGSSAAWTITTTPAGNQAFRGIGYGNGLYVACNSTGNVTNGVIYSSDGISWSLSASLPTTKYWSCVGYGTPGGTPRFVIAAYGDPANHAPIWSDDGVNWTIGGNTYGDFHGITYGDNKYVIVGPNVAAYSADGKTWTQATVSARSWREVVYTGTQFVAISLTGQAMYSTDAVTWTETTSGIPSSGSYYGLAYGNGTLVAVDIGGGVIYSTDDGLNWTSTTPPEANAWRGVSFGAGAFYATAGGGTNRTMWSLDGINWNAQPSADDSKEWVDITYGDGKFVAVSETGSSNDRVMYQGYTGPPNSELLLVNRSNVSYKCTIADVASKVLDTDSLLVNRSGVSYKVAGAEFKTSVLPSPTALTISTWTGNYGTKKIADGANYSAGGGLVIIKQYTGGSTEGWRWFSQPLGISGYYDTSTANGPRYPGNGLASLDADGYTLGSDSAINNSTVQQIGFGFVPIPGAFSIESYNNAGSQTHSLGVEPEYAITRSFSYADWMIYHKDLGHDKALVANLSNGAFNQSGIFGTSAQWSATNYFVSGNAFAGAPGTQHQAWLFANKPGVCKIGTYVGSGSMTRVRVDCGFKPGLVIIKGDNSSRWVVMDMVRGDLRPLYLDLTNAQGYFSGLEYESDDTGFSVANTNGNINGIAVTYYFIALAAGEGVING